MGSSREHRIREEALSNVRHYLEHHQVAIYLSTVGAAAAIATLLPPTPALARATNPAVAVMLFVTFLQVPLVDLGRAFMHVRFLCTLLVSNFIFVPLLVAFLTHFLPLEPIARFGLLLVLLAPCIDYVVTFSYMGGADARLLLAATPALLIAQMLLLPAYLRIFLGDASADLIQPGPFIHAFVWLLVVPLASAAITQIGAARSTLGKRLATGLSVLPVPATALVLFIIVAAVMPQLGNAVGTALRVLPVYVAFAAVAPLIGWTIARIARLETPACRAVAFSTATRNSLVILPLALAVPGAVPVLPAIIVTQTMVELLASVVYIKVIPKLGSRPASNHKSNQR